MAKHQEITQAIDSLLVGGDAAEQAGKDIALALAHYATGQRTKIAHTVGVWHGAFVAPKGFNSGKLASLKIQTKYRAHSRVMVQWLREVEAGNNDFVSMVAGFKKLVAVEKEAIKDERVSALTTEQIAARAAKAAESTAKRATMELEKAMALVQAHGRAGTLPAWFIAHMGELAKVHA